jgi:hypothetical protein
MSAVSPIRIEKEQIPNQSFSPSEVLSSGEEIIARSELLSRACLLGNSHKGKVRIGFITPEGPKEVYTTIWTVSNGHIALKNGAHIPIHSIYSINI